MTASRESAMTKGRRYLVEGRVSILEVDRGRVVADVRGDGETHACGYGASRWWCNCPARTRCAHLVALGLVVDVTRLTEVTSCR